MVIVRGALKADCDVQLLFTDIHMRGAINGLALAKREHERWPHIGIMLASARPMQRPHGLPAGSRLEHTPRRPSGRCIST
jgi:two-component system, response regulator PdtaR